MHYAVLTNDLYLYLGVKHSLGSYKCEHYYLSGGDALIEPVNILILFVDTRIFFSKIWKNFNKILSCNPQTNVLWLTHRSSCRFLLDDIGFHQEIDRHDSHFFQRVVAHNMKQKEKRKLSVGINDFAMFDLKLLRCLVAGMSLEEISINLKRSVKQIYAFRSRLALKIGLRHASYLSFHLDNISPFVFYLNLLIYKERRMDICERKKRKIKMEPIYYLSASGRYRKGWYPHGLLDHHLLIKPV